jgi:hypothetical protein
VGAFVTGIRNGKASQLTVADGDSRAFDSFECAIHAPSCEYRWVRVIGHGVEAGAEGLAGRA